jgi:hypothetical protein
VSATICEIARLRNHLWFDGIKNHGTRRVLVRAIAANASAGLHWLTRTEPNFDETRAAFTEIVEDAHRASDVIASIRGMLLMTYRIFRTIE